MPQRRGFSGDKERTIGLLERKAAEDLEEKAALKAKLGKLADVKNPFGSRTLKECEIVIEAGIIAHVDFWLALKEVHDRKLYRPSFEDFKSYCENRWGYVREGYRYLAAANVTTVVTPTLPPPPTSAHANALARLLDEPDKLREAWSEALELNDGHPTFLEVRDVVAGFLPPKSPDLGPTDDGRESGRSVSDVRDESESSPSRAAANPAVPPEGSGPRDSANVEVGFRPLSDKIPFHGEIAPSDMRQDSGPPPQPLSVDFSTLPNNAEWTLDTVRSYRSHINSYIRLAAKYSDAPDVRVWMQSLYHFVKESLGYDV